MCQCWTKRAGRLIFLLLLGAIQIAPSQSFAQDITTDPIKPVAETSTRDLSPTHIAAITETSTQPGLPADRGIYGKVSSGGGHDSLSGYAGNLEFSLGYDVSHSLELEAGIPIFWLSTQEDHSNTGANVYSYRYGSLGDVFLKLEFSPDLDVIDYTASVTGTLPTGANNATAGGGTWDWNNRFQHEFWKPFNPFAEIVLGNVLPVATRPIAFPGVISQIRVGDTVKFYKTISFDASFYEALPISGQHSSASVTPLDRIVQLSDHGFMASLTASRSRAEFEVTYQRSISNRLDTVWATISYRIGHVRRSDGN